MTQCCSLLVLCVGAVAALSAIAAVAISINTDHWTHILVSGRRSAFKVRAAGKLRAEYFEAI